MLPMIPTECMKVIFQYVKKNDESLYPSLFVNHHWCINAVPLLWACLFDKLNFDIIYKITSVYISLLEEYEKSHFKMIIIKNLYEPKTILKLIPDKRPLFNYSMMLDEFSLKSLEIISHSWITVFWPDKNFDESRKQIMQIKEQMILFLFKLFTKNANLKFLTIDSDKILNYVPDIQHTIGQFLNILKFEIGYAA
ncbi:29432_t:CDS:1 [Racocetra persica]|uniref:29432_t:CDS:1 n=1 Tax=Racocetra persica TaxID=160502 RepID=A0ACA9KJK7_9GLOM|nr:29432_t:CDS:1 [Racocetra persica]